MHPRNFVLPTQYAMDPHSTVYQKLTAAGVPIFAIVELLLHQVVYEAYAPEDISPSDLADAVTEYLSELIDVDKLIAVQLDTQQYQTAMHELYRALWKVKHVLTEGAERGTFISGVHATGWCGRDVVASVEITRMTYRARPDC